MISCTVWSESFLLATIISSLISRAAWSGSTLFAKAYLSHCLECYGILQFLSGDVLGRFCGAFCDFWRVWPKLRFCHLLHSWDADRMANCRSWSDCSFKSRLMWVYSAGDNYFSLCVLYFGSNVYREFGCVYTFSFSWNLCHSIKD